MVIISEIDKLKHFHVENYSGTNFTDDLNDGEEFLYGGFVGNLGLVKKTMEEIY
nr:MAG: hypothetical protein [Bacteriophage sp.]